MSYPYRVVVTKGVSECLTASDRSERSVELPPILDRERSLQILREALRRRGWEGEGTVLTRKREGLEESYDLETGVVTTVAEGSDTIQRELSLEGVGDAGFTRPTQSEQEALRRRVEQELDKRLAITEKEREERRRELEGKLADRLRESDEERTRELNEVLLEVYAESLKEKARGMGNVTELREERTEDGDYELVIRIEA